MANKIVTFQNTAKTEGKLPRTVLKAIFDDNGNYLDPELTASDINALKGGAMASLSATVGDIKITLFANIETSGSAGQTITFETSDNVYICFARTRGSSNASLFYLTPRGGAITVVNLGGSQQASYYITASGTTITFNANYSNLFVFKIG